MNDREQDQAAEPSIEVKAGEPSIEVNGGEPSVEVKVGEPSIDVESGEPSIDVESDELPVRGERQEPHILLSGGPHVVEVAPGQHVAARRATDRIHDPHAEPMAFEPLKVPTFDPAAPPAMPARRGSAEPNSPRPGVPASGDARRAPSDPPPQTAPTPAPAVQPVAAPWSGRLRDLEERTRRIRNALSAIQKD